MIQLAKNKIYFDFRSDIRGIVTTLLHSNVADVNSTVSERDLRTSLHLAAAMGNLPVAQILIWVKSLFDIAYCCSSC